MSRRREAQDLAHALALSAQDAPQELSSSSLDTRQTEQPGAESTQPKTKRQRRSPKASQGSGELSEPGDSSVSTVDVPVEDTAPQAASTTDAPAGDPIPSPVVPSSRSPSPTKLSAASARKRFFGKPITSLLPSSPSHVPGLKRHVRLPPLHTNRRSPPPPKPRLPQKETKKPRTEGSSDEEEAPEPEIDYENEGFL
ncbi:hypothetical protein MNAN1_003698 [Malassezia nana]|uniref:Uncharacterized protein n=1 Tax=Malassezia nana TaxID=180528 RepID=A0AAF0EQA2_9BASI|nr:hypothetical protein MNAN1_003698 [Malassezia nana]